MKINFSQFETLFEEAKKNNKAFSLDWKFPVEDIVFNIKSVCPNLDIQSIPEKQVNGDWFQTMIVEGTEYSFNTESETLILDLISTVNKHLQKINQALVFFDTQDDDYYFFLVSIENIQEYLDQGFVRV